jgi:hypothetical protein
MHIMTLSSLISPWHSQAAFGATKRDNCCVWLQMASVAVFVRLALFLGLMLQSSKAAAPHAAG